MSKLTEEWARWGCPAQDLLRGAAQPPSPLAGAERSQCSPCVGTQWAVPWTRAFPSASVNISQPPLRLGARSSSERQHLCPGQPWGPAGQTEWPCQEGGVSSGVPWPVMDGPSHQPVQQPWALSLTDAVSPLHGTFKVRTFKDAKAHLPARTWSLCHQRRRG